MLKRDKNYRLPKTVKRMMAGKFCQNSNAFKNAMIDAHIIGSIVVKSSKKTKGEKTVAAEE